MFLLGIGFLTLKAFTITGLLMPTLGYTWLALFYATVLLYSVTRPSSLVSRVLKFKWLGWLGGIAYGIYLFHEFILGILFGYFWGHEPRTTGGSTFLTALVALALTFIVARLSWRYFENPLIRFGHRTGYTFAESSPKVLPQSAPEVVRP